MLDKDTKIIVSNRNLISIQDVKKDTKIYTFYGTDVVTDTSSKKETGYKFIFSDGYKCIFGESQELLMPNETWKSVVDIKENDVVMKPDSTTAKIVDITKVGKITGYTLTTKNNCGYILANGAYTR